MSDTATAITTENRVLVLAPTGRDAELTASLLADHGFACRSCEDARDLLAELAEGAASLLLAEEALQPEMVEKLEGRLTEQPFWSDLPLVVLTRREGVGLPTGPALDLLGPVGNITLLERPVRVNTLTSAVRAAVRARKRQYEVRDLVHRLAEMDRRKDEFLAMLSHELRNPLGAIRSALAVLQGLDERPEARTPHEVIDRQVRHLAHLLEDLLDTARIQEGKITLAPVSVDLGSLIGDCLLALSDTHRKRVAVQVPRDPLTVRADPVRLDQVLSNLLQNALKYSPPESPVTVRLAEDGPSAVITVEDRGIGIEADMLPRIFEPFTQVEASLARSEGGLGLGLPLVRNLVELHGGEVTVESEGPGAGSLFRVRLPLSVESTGPEPTDAVEEAAFRREVNTILVIEDDPDNRHALEGLLDLWGYEPITAPDGRAGIDTARDHRPQVALVDIGLPGMSGYDVARELRRAHPPEDLYLIALTGYGQAEDRQQAEAAGFDLHLVKPVNPERLKRLLGELAPNPDAPHSPPPR